MTWFTAVVKNWFLRLNLGILWNDKTSKWNDKKATWDSEANDRNWYSSNSNSWYTDD